MALNANKTTPVFEDPENEGGDVATAGEAAQPTAQKRLQEAAAKRASEQETSGGSTALAAKSAGAGAVAVNRKMDDPFKVLENAYTVDWNTLRNLVITQGNVVDKDTDKPLGDEIGLELLSFQKQWVVGPGGDDKSDEAKALVRYSNDGVTSTQGDDMKAHLQNLRNTGYPKAKMDERLVIVGSVFDIGVKGRKDLKNLQDELVQINLPPTSKDNFNRYRMGQAFQIGKGLVAAEGADRIRITCNLKKNGDNTYTLASFSRYDTPAAE